MSIRVYSGIPVEKKFFSVYRYKKILCRLYYIIFLACFEQFCLNKNHKKKMVKLGRLGTTQFLHLPFHSGKKEEKEEEEG